MSKETNFDSRLWALYPKDAGKTTGSFDKSKIQKIIQASSVIKAVESFRVLVPDMGVDGYAVETISPDEAGKHLERLAAKQAAITKEREELTKLLQKIAPKVTIYIKDGEEGPSVSLTPFEDLGPEDEVTPVVVQGYLGDRTSVFIVETSNSSSNAAESTWHAFADRDMAEKCELEGVDSSDVEEHSLVPAPDLSV